MAGAGFHIDLAELVPMVGALEGARDRGEDLSPLMDAIGMAMETTTHERFATESDAQGRKWKPSIRKLREGGTTLTMDGHLDNSITHVFDSSSTEIGSNLIYARPNFFGATITAKSGHLKFRLPGGLGFRSVQSVVLPARNPLGIGGDDELTVVELAENYFLGGMAA